MSARYHVTDVFAEAPYTGNQLATFLSAADIDGAEMQRIARAFNFAESTFVTGGSLADGFDVRIFTPAEELPFAGHPALGTAHLLREVMHPQASAITLNLGVGPIVVCFVPDDSGGVVAWMEQNPCSYGDELDRSAAARALGLEPGDVDASMPVQEVSTGLATVVVPLTSLAALRRIEPDNSAIRGFLSAAAEAKNVLVVCREPYEAHQQVAARMFAPELGVTEDPATGSANGAFAGYILRHSYLGEGPVRAAIGQGYEIGRPSTLWLEAGAEGGAMRIRVGGRVATVAVGDWLPLMD